MKTNWNTFVNKIVKIHSFFVKASVDPYFGAHFSGGYFCQVEGFFRATCCPKRGCGRIMLVVWGCNGEMTPVMEYSEGEWGC